MRRLHLWLLGLAVLVPAMASAQEIDFDAACPSPPCNVGTLFSASSVSFTPNTSQIRGAGVDGLTGTNGGSYLRVAAFPYQQTITHGRLATFVTFDLSRGTSSSGALSVQVTALKAGVPVGNTTVTLTTVNIWTRVSFTIAGGFDTIFIDPSGGANNTFGLDSLTFGGTCYGFSDVAPTDIFCNASEWLANRGVTLGCLVGQYCPAFDVTRGQMALFMNRLGNALSPLFLSATAINGGSDPGGGTVYCETGDYLVPYPQVAQAFVTLNLFGPPALGLYRFRAVASTDGGVTWNVIASQVSYESVSPGQGASGPNTSLPVNMSTGATYRFGVRVDRFSGSAGGLTEVQCQVHVRIDNQGNTTAAPFDPAPLTGTGPSSYR